MWNTCTVIIFSVSFEYKHFNCILRILGKHFAPHISMIPCIHHYQKHKQIANNIPTVNGYMGIYCCSIIEMRVIVDVISNLCRLSKCFSNKYQFVATSYKEQYENQQYLQVWPFVFYSNIKLLYWNTYLLVQNFNSIFLLRYLC